MSAAPPFGGFEERDEPGLGRAIALAFGVHLVLIVILLLGVRWQSHPPAAMTVELWETLPTKPAPKMVPPPPPKPAPKIVPPPPPKVEPKPQPKPEPRIEKPDIAVKTPPKPKPPPPKPEAKPKPPPPKPVAKPKPAAPRKDDEFRKQLQAQLAREEAEISAQRQDAELRQLLAADAASERSKALANWVDKIRAKIRGNIVLPPAINGNPEARFEIVLLPTGEVLSVNKKKSSGHAALDDAIDRAIRKSSPLPKPDDARVFERRLEITYRPFENR
jgi:colicin import membrane protein